MTELYHAGLKQRIPVPVPDKKPHRVDLWVQAFDGTYRLFLDLPQICELERKTGFVDKDGNQRAGSIFQLYDRVSRGRYDLGGEIVGVPTEGAASIADLRETVRLALIGGRCAVVDGERVDINPRRALELIETYCTDVPLEEPWRLAFLILSAVISGRDEEPHEVGTHSRMPVFPPVAQSTAKPKRSARPKSAKPAAI